jgi:hypothetical protein
MLPRLPRRRAPIQIQTLIQIPTLMGEEAMGMREAAMGMGEADAT